MAVLGDTAQFVSMGKKRISQINDAGSVRMTVQFAPGETSRTIVGYSATKPIAWSGSSQIPLTFDADTRQFQIVLSPGADGTASVHLRRLRVLPRK